MYNKMNREAQQNGSLYQLSPPYVCWEVGRNEIVLDGEFTIDDLKWIVAHMEMQGQLQQHRAVIPCVRGAR